MVAEVDGGELKWSGTRSRRASKSHSRSDRTFGSPIQECPEYLSEWQSCNWKCDGNALCQESLVLRTLIGGIMELQDLARSRVLARASGTRRLIRLGQFPIKALRIRIVCAHAIR